MRELLELFCIVSTGTRVFGCVFLCVGLYSIYTSEKEGMSVILSIVAHFEYG